MFHGSSNWRNFLIKIVILIETTVGTTAYFSTIDCPTADIERGILSAESLNWSPAMQKQCTLHFACPNVAAAEQLVYQGKGDEIYREDSHEFAACESGERETGCDVEFKVTVVEDLPGVEETTRSINPCPISAGSPEKRELWAHPENCSLFFKCDWSEPVLFECPENLHFNTELQICDWPWQAGCDKNWSRCLRPKPHCPAQHSRPIYLPHPNLCDKFYQCDWGEPHLQNCPTGLHFNINLKVCDWPYNAKCNIC